MLDGRGYSLTRHTLITLSTHHDRHWQWSISPSPCLSALQLGVETAPRKLPIHSVGDAVIKYRCRHIAEARAALVVPDKCYIEMKCDRRLPGP